MKVSGGISRVISTFVYDQRIVLNLDIGVKDFFDDIAVSVGEIFR